ncbi:MAG: pyridine nucleotide-disulfide oxidoreductase [Rhodobacterales bacterium]|nr:MAG: pyridine nucleotide-disulfide oxidoreductase [Rhodobacterales bacterium]
MRHVMILGAGFGALTAVRELRKKGFDGKITLVSPKAQLTYLPSLIWMPSGERKASDLEVDLTAFFARNRVDWHQGRVEDVRDGGRRVITDTGELTNDFLIIATGGRYIKKLPGMAEHALVPCEGTHVGQAIHDRLAAMEGGDIVVGFGTNMKEPKAARGGPMFEFLFGIDTLLRRQGRRDRFRLTFVNGNARPGNRLGDKAVDGLLKQMEKRGIEAHLGAKPIAIEADRVVTERAEHPSDLTLFMPGLTGPAWLMNNADLPKSEGGFIAADEMCRVKDTPQTYVIGDSGSYPGPEWLAKQAHQADLQAVAAVANILDEMAGKPPTHRFKPELICIIDMLDRGVLVYRNQSRSFFLPMGRPGTWAKSLFEHRYLKKYRE